MVNGRGKSSYANKVEQFEEVTLEARPVKGDTIVTERDESFVVKDVILRENELQRDEILVLVSEKKNNTKFVDEVIEE